MKTAAALSLAFALSDAAPMITLRNDVSVATLDETAGLTSFSELADADGALALRNDGWSISLKLASGALVRFNPLSGCQWRGASSAAANATLTWSCEDAGATLTVDAVCVYLRTHNLNDLLTATHFTPRRVAGTSCARATRRLFPSSL